MSDTKTITLRACSLTIDQNGLPKVSEPAARDSTPIAEGTVAEIIEKLPNGELWVRVSENLGFARCHKNKELGSEAANKYLSSKKGERSPSKKETMAEALERLTRN